VVGWLEERNPTTHPKTASRLRKKEQAIWQRSFWEHLIQDDQDFIWHVRHIDYVLVKHGFVEAS